MAAVRRATRAINNGDRAPLMFLDIRAALASIFTLAGLVLVFGGLGVHLMLAGDVEIEAQDIRPASAFAATKEPASRGPDLVSARWPQPLGEGIARRIAVSSEPGGAPAASPPPSAASRATRDAQAVNVKGAGSQITNPQVAGPQVANPQVAIRQNANAPAAIAKVIERADDQADIQAAAEEALRLDRIGGGAQISTPAPVAAVGGPFVPLPRPRVPQGDASVPRADSAAPIAASGVAATPSAVAATAVAATAAAAPIASDAIARPKRGIAQKRQAKPQRKKFKNPFASIFGR
ncbi:MAG: hypothetical protein HY056_06680 [Proteobacteria bacterium]|nr:hypothetical protein [Pseudomonadota bacterium]